MNTITLQAHAKINPSLDVLARREDGYHEVRLIMQLIELHDIEKQNGHPSVKGMKSICEQLLEAGL